MYTKLGGNEIYQLHRIYSSKLHTNVLNWLGLAHFHELVRFLLAVQVRALS